MGFLAESPPGRARVDIDRPIAIGSLSASAIGPLINHFYLGVIWTVEWLDFS